MRQQKTLKGIHSIVMMANTTPIYTNSINLRKFLRIMIALVIGHGIIAPILVIGELYASD